MKKTIKKPSYKGKAAKVKKQIKADDGFVAVNIKKHNDKNGGHFHIIVEDYEYNHVSVGLSTKLKKGKKGGNNYTMEKSPFDDGKQSYMRRQGKVAPKKEYDKLLKGTITPKDYGQAKIYGERAKQKYKEKEGKKK